MNTLNWIEKLKPGDKVFIAAGQKMDLYLREVARVTKTLVFLKGRATEEAYSKKTFTLRGVSGPFTPVLVEFASNVDRYTADRDKRKLFDTLTSSLNRSRLNDLDNKTVSSLLAALEPFEDL